MTVVRFRRSRTDEHAGRERVLISVTAGRVFSSCPARAVLPVAMETASVRAMALKSVSGWTFDGRLRLRLLRDRLQMCPNVLKTTLIFKTSTPFMSLMNNVV